MVIYTCFKSHEIPLNDYLVVGQEGRTDGRNHG